MLTRAKVFDGPPDAILKTNLRTPVKHRPRPAGIQAGPLQVTGSRRRRSRRIGRTDCGGHQGVQRAITGFHAGANVEALT